MAYYMKYIKTFSEITNNDIQLVGGKALSLGIITDAGIPVAPGFVVTTDAYKAFQSKTIPQDVQTEILDAFAMLASERVAVRSSAIAEDSKMTSWAGQLETYLNVTQTTLLENITKCWSSIHSQRAVAYAQIHGISIKEQSVAVVVQKMVKSEVSGVLFTVNPVTKNSNEMMVEAVYGLGELLVQGLVTPANFIIDKPTLTIKSQTKGEQNTRLVFRAGENKEEPVPTNLQAANILDGKKIQELATLAIKIEDLYKAPQDIEWALENGNVFILQSRPITSF